ncbi:hypothetical protein AUJ77_01840 [Candidatus Nomurabacteria bacterium CG1_02_43_90]|uniref:DUF5667 domain-containing protein n=1 Tax=Candidatus Nomurabacteria bacterium CG1_02_43_90 TaxID=1805281 RepID=A0A1J4V866_9BACT|nr:MAG: hypothetical protein AUJ77_01840 [Candidatus Nomurabacteria bacterium CG1_02_43_90]
MKKLFIFGAILLSAPFVSFAQVTATGTAAVNVTATTSVATTTVAVSASTTVAVDPGLVPGDFFYPLSLFGEKVNLFFTFNPEKKARLHLEYAKERVAEIKEVLKNPNAKIQDVATAKDNFASQISGASTIVKSEKEKGVDVAGLASDLSVEIDDSSVEIKDVLHAHQNSIVQAENEIRAQIEAVASSNPAKVQELTKKLGEITKEKNDTTKEEGDTNANISDQQGVLEQVMGAELSAKKHVEEAIHLNEQLGEMKGQVSEKQVEQIKKQTEQAKEAMQKGNFEEANRISNEATQKVEEIKAVQENEREAVSASMSVPGRTTPATVTAGIRVESTVGGEVRGSTGVKQGERMMESVGGKEKSGNNETNATDR